MLPSSWEAMAISQRWISILVGRARAGARRMTVMLRSGDGGRIALRRPGRFAHRIKP